MELINDPRRDRATLEAIISVTPEGDPIEITIDGDTFTWDEKHHAVNTLLTFTVAVNNVDFGSQIVEYRWDMGDGQTLYGPSVDYTFLNLNPDSIVIVHVRDSSGRIGYGFKSLALLAAGGGSGLYGANLYGSDLYGM